MAESVRDSTRYNRLQATLYELQTGSNELLPEIDLPGGEARRFGRHPIGGNGFFDIWKGLWLGRDEVAMKTLRSVRVEPKTREVNGISVCIN